MTRAHFGEFDTEHKSVSEMLARSRTSVWIGIGTWLNISVRFRNEGLIVRRHWILLALSR